MARHNGWMDCFRLRSLSYGGQVAALAMTEADKPRPGMPARQFEDTFRVLLLFFQLFTCAGIIFQFRLTRTGVGFHYISHKRPADSSHHNRWRLKARPDIDHFSASCSEREVLCLEGALF
jgi:hypothetical protein